MKRLLLTLVLPSLAVCHPSWIRLALMRPASDWRT